MQTIQFLQTAKWIKSQFSEVTIEMLLEGQILRYVREVEPSAVLSSSDFRNAMLKIIHDLSTVQPRLASRPLACEVLNAFGLAKLVDPNFPVEFGEMALSPPTKEKKTELRQEMFFEIRHKWRLFQECLEPIEKITTPPRIIAEKEFDEILTIELRYSKDFDPPIQTICDVLKNINDIYSDVTKLIGAKDAGNLVTIYAASGTGYRFDFKGLGEPIKEIKKLFVETWDRIRHRKAEDLERNSRAVLIGLQTLDTIKSRRDKKAITNEDADKLCQKINKSMLDIFGRGALIREIPREQTVSNQELIEGIQQKRLPPPSPKQLPEPKKLKKPLKKPKAKKQKS